MKNLAVAAIALFAACAMTPEEQLLARARVQQMFPNLPTPPRPVAPYGGLPPNVGSEHQREVTGCSDDPLSMRLINDTSKAYIELELDGQPVVIIDGLPMRTRGGRTIVALRPGAIAHVCLDRLGEHELKGIVYSMRGGVLTPLRTFVVRESFNGFDPHSWFLNDGYIITSRE